MVSSLTHAHYHHHFRYRLFHTSYLQHLGHFLLTHLLLPKLRLTAEKAGLPSSVITVSSSLHHNATRPCSSSSPYSITKWWNNFRWLTSWRMSEPGIDLGDLNCEKKKYSLFGQYSQSKLANVMFSLELNRRESKLRLVPHGEMRLTNKTYPQVVSYCLHPGLVRTDFIVSEEQTIFPVNDGIAFAH